MIENSRTPKQLTANHLDEHGSSLFEFIDTPTRDAMCDRIANESSNNDDDDDRAEYKRASVQIVLLLVVVMYVFVGACVFDWLETNAQNQRMEDLGLHKRACFINMTRAFAEQDPATCDTAVNKAFDKCAQREYVGVWRFTHATAFAFSIVTVLGFGDVQVLTNWGKVFYLIYALVGIPLVMVVLANFGKFMIEASNNVRERTRNRWKQRRRFRSRLASLRRRSTFWVSDAEKGDPTDHGNHNADDGNEVEYNAKIFLIMFTLYIAIGTISFILISPDPVTLLDAVYHNFRALTADFAEIAPQNVGLLLFALCYICVGVTFVTTAFDLLGIQLKKIHFNGVKLKNATMVKIWFGSQRMSVGKLVTSVGHAANVPDDVMAGIDLDKLVSTALEGGDCRPTVVRQMSLKISTSRASSPPSAPPPSPPPTPPKTPTPEPVSPPKTPTPEPTTPPITPTPEAQIPSPESPTSQPKIESKTDLTLSMLPPLVNVVKKPTKAEILDRLVSGRPATGRRTSRLAGLQSTPKSSPSVPSVRNRRGVANNAVGRYTMAVAMSNIADVASTTARSPRMSRKDIQKTVTNEKNEEEANLLEPAANSGKKKLEEPSKTRRVQRPPRKSPVQKVKSPVG